MVTDLKEWRVGQYGRALWLVFGAVALLFAIAVANIAGLMLVQLRRPQVDARLWLNYHATHWPHHLTRTIMY